MSPLEVFNSPTNIVDAMWEGITMIEAQNTLSQLTVADWPNKKSSDRTKIHKELFNKAYPHLSEKKITVVTQQDLNRVLGLK